MKKMEKGIVTVLSEHDGVRVESDDNEPCSSPDKPDSNSSHLGINIAINCVCFNVYVHVHELSISMVPTGIINWHGYYISILSGAIIHTCTLYITLKSSAIL